MHKDINDLSNAAVAQALHDDIRRFKEKAGREKQGALRLLVSDFEFRYDMDAFRRYQTDENDATKGWVRWPFCHVVAGAWTCLTFRADTNVPDISPIVTLVADEQCEQAIVEAYFQAIEAHTGAILTSWGGEQKDVPVLRRVAGECGIAMPTQLRDLRVHASTRLDLCNATSTQARCVHLPEFCTATGIPSKAFPSKHVGHAAASGHSEIVAEQVRSDLFATAIVATRHAISHAMTSVNVVESEQAIARAFAEAYPRSHFLRQAGRCLASARGIPISTLAA